VVVPPVVPSAVPLFSVFVGEEPGERVSNMSQTPAGAVPTAMPQVPPNPFGPPPPDGNATRGPALYVYFMNKNSDAYAHQVDCQECCYVGIRITVHRFLLSESVYTTMDEQKPRSGGRHHGSVSGKQFHRYIPYELVPTSYRRYSFLKAPKFR
jgi:hypothetical protein